MGRKPNRSALWEADLIPVAAQCDDPTARPAVVIVAAADAPLHVDVVLHPPSDPEGVARVIVDAVVEASEMHGRRPSALHVRNPDVARVITRIGSLGPAVVEATDVLGAIERACDDMQESIPGLKPGPRVASPETWAGWALPRSAVAELFAAAAAFHRASPWRVVANEQTLTAMLPAGREWIACVLGRGGQEFGLVLYERRDDLDAFLFPDDPAAHFPAVSGVVLSLTFDRFADTPERMQREVEAEGWELAGPDACPVLVTINTLGGGLTTEHAADLTALLCAVPAFVERHRQALAGAADVALPIEWTHEPTGTTLRYEGVDDLFGETLWGPHETLTPSLPSGAGARADASLVLLEPDTPSDADADRVREEELRVADRFGSALRGRRGSRGASSARRQEEDARLFIEFLTGYQAIPVRAVSEFDLRVFLYDWYPRKVAAPLSAARAVHAMLGRFFEFLAAEEAIVCEWAREVLGEREFFELRVEEFPGGLWWDDDVQGWQQELWDDLDARVMVPDDAFGDGDTWGATMGPAENALYHVLQRRWLVWRDEAIRAGTVAPEAVRAALIEREGAWLRDPAATSGGKTPLEAIRKERASQRKSRSRAMTRQGHGALSPPASE